MADIGGALPSESQAERAGAELTLDIEEMQLAYPWKCPILRVYTGSIFPG
jgi:hypothetical protein